MKKTTLILTILVLSGCVAQKPMGEIPTRESDFALTPAELIEAYPSIKDNNLEYIQDATTKTPTLKIFEEKWGPHVSIKDEWTDYAFRTGYLFGLGYTGLGESTSLWPLFGALLTLPNALPHQTYTWNKGDYSIDVTFTNPIFADEKKSLYWNWKEKESVKSILPPITEKPFYFLGGYSAGGDTVFFTATGGEAHSIGFGTTLLLGYELGLTSNNDYNIRIESGVKYTGVLIPSSGAKLTEIPVNMMLSGKIMDDLVHLGLGIGYKVSPTLYGGPGQTTTELDDAISGMIQVEYRPASGAGVVFRYEALNYSAPNISDIEASNFGTYFTVYF